METISRLRAVLINALDNRGAQYAEQEVFDELIIHKPRLVKVFDVGIRDVEQQREIESGKTVINGKKVAVNSDFARQVIFLSQQLECSERYVAGLLHSVMSENPNLDPVRCIELTVSEFHQRRRDLADCLRYLFQATEAAQYEDASPLCQHIGHFARTEIMPPERQGSGLIPIAYRIFKEIENLGTVLSRADASRKNARSDTAIPPAGQGSPSLGADILNARYESLKYERRSLATSLYLLARLGWFSPNEVKVIVEWLQTNPNNAMTYYMLTTILAAFDPADPQSFSGQARTLLANDQANMTFMTQKLAPTTQWKEPGLKATILLKWTLFLATHRHNNPQLENREGFRTEELETQIWNAVQGDLFAYLGVAVLQLQRRYGVFHIPSVMVNLVSSTEQEQREVPSDDFRLPVLTAFETLIRLLITHASSELRKIKQRQEDLVLANARDRSRGPGRFGGSVVPEGDKPQPRNDIALLYSFIGLLYSSLPEESALQFWGAGPQGEMPPTYLELFESSAGRLPAFLQWAVWSTQAHDATMTMALFDMLAGLAKGQHCSELAYNFMARGGGEVIPGSSLPNSGSGSTVSWDIIFGLLDAWASGATVRTAPNHSLSQSGMNQLTYQNQNQQHTELSIGPSDVLLAQSFLRLLSAVVTYSVAVRVAISGHTQFRAIPTLVSLIPLSVPLELKGMLFETLSAFCQPGAGIPGLEICRAVWTLMEKLEVINVRPLPSTGYSITIRPGKGVEVELDEIEGSHGLYPATIPFLKLLSTLLHTPKRIPLKDRVTEVVPINTIPDSLGQPYRLPGIGPFTSFVIDHVFARIPTRDFLRPSERWQMNDLCLCFIERALASYDLEGFLAAAESGELKSNIVAPYLVHPGYDILQRLLTNTSTSLQTTIISYVVEGLGGFDKGLAKEEPYFESTIVRVLRIVLRVLEIQDVFLDVLIPTLSDIDSAPLVGTTHPRSFFTRFDQALSFVPQYVPALAAYVAYPSHSEVVLLSVKILAILSRSNAFTNLATSIERSEESDRILMGYVHALETETTEDVTIAETIAEQVTGAGAPDVDEIPASLEQAIRAAILDLLIQNTETNRPYPNFAHFLLFGSTKSEHGIQDPHALGAQKACIHVILELLNIGIPTLKGKGKGRHRELSSTPLFALLPALAERCYHVVHQLCVHPRTSAFTMRYLRTREDFFARHLAAVPSQVPQRSEEPPHILVQYQDGARVTTTTATLNSFLSLRSWIFNLVALDLHVLTNKGQHGAVAELLDILFGNDSSIEEANIWEDEIARPFREVGQSHLRIIEFVQSLTFDWSDTLEVQAVELQFLGQLNLLSCVRKDSSGCDIIDRGELLSLLTTARRALFSQNSIVTPAQAEQLNVETNYILESCAVENHRRQIVHATSTGFEAWRRLLDTTLTKCFDRLPHDHRENMLFDILHVLPPIINSGSIHDSTAVLLSEVILSSITKLREDRRHQIILQSAGGDPDSGALPAERLYAILRSILECILNSNGVELVRGNLYAALINYNHLISSSADLSSMHNDSRLALTWSTKREDSPFGDSMAIVPRKGQSRTRQGESHLIQTNSLDLMQGSLERLVVTIARDAIDGTEVWRTVAFMALDSLVQLSALDKSHPVPTYLVRHGILSNFVQGLNESDFLLQSVLKPDPDDLNPLYVYEAKMSLFIRMAQTRLGAERLLETRLIPALAQCDYLDARPEADSSFVDHDTFLPSAIQRYHQLLMPSLQLVNALLATLGAKHATASNQALDFLSRHSATIVILVKNETDDLSLALLEEVHLIVSLCAQVLPLVSQNELMSTHSGFGAINSAILSLSTGCFAGGPWVEQIRPQTDTEITDANTPATGFGPETKFEANVRRTEKTLRKALVAYAGATSDFTEPEISPVLSPICTLSRHEEKGHFLATIPTIGDALEALSTLCNDLAGTLRQISDISAELGARALIAVDNVQDIVGDIDIDFIQDLEIDQKRALICRELERIGQVAKGDASLSISTIEMLLLLLWRHLGFYADDQTPKNPNTNTFAASAMRFLATPDPESLRQDVGKRLGPILQRLQSLIVDDESLAEEWQANQAYVEIMCRRIRDCAGLHDGEQMADDNS